MRQPIENFKFFIIGDLHLVSQITLLALVVQKMDSAINWINCTISSEYRFVRSWPMDYRYPLFEQAGHGK